jgi:hypothetical protein
MVANAGTGEVDARVLNRLAGHLDSATPEKIFQNPRNELFWRGRPGAAQHGFYLGVSGHPGSQECAQWHPDVKRPCNETVAGPFLTTVGTAGFEPATP